MNRAAKLLGGLAALIISWNAMAEPGYLDTISVVCYQDPTTARYAEVQSRIAATGNCYRLSGLDPVNLHKYWYEEDNYCDGTWDVNRVAYTGTCEIPTCGAGYEWSDVTHQCEQLPTCDAGITKTFSGPGTTPGGLCVQGCVYGFDGLGVELNSGTPIWYSQATSTGQTCDFQSDYTEAPTPDDGLPPGCRYGPQGHIFCGAATQGDNCGTYNGVEVCTGSGTNQGYVNGDFVDATAEKNCGIVNGEKVCVQPPDPGQWGPQNSAPEGCMVDENGNKTCINDETKTFSTTSSVDNGDGTTTVTTTVTSNVVNEGSTTTTTVINNATGDVVSSSTTTDGAAPGSQEGETSYDYSGPDGQGAEAEYAGKLEDSGIGGLTEGMGTDADGLGDHGITSPIPNISGSCQQLTFGLAGKGITFPEDGQCAVMNQIRDYLEYFVYAITIILLIEVATRRV